MSRPTMLRLINRVRLLIADPASESQTWTDDEIEAALDRNRAEARYAQLREIETIAAGGAVTYKIFSADTGDLEEDVSLVDNGFNALTPATADYAIGRFEFTTEPARPVMMTGFYYDCYGAAIEVIEHWIAKLKGSIDLKVDGLDLKRSQKVEHLAALADRYRSLAWASRPDQTSTGRMMQTDFYPEERRTWPY